ncbi:MAG: M48 family metallopeptidase [Candidatus Omnitrophica bacterium]|nr:M48 family metallopeptidase [Candidatus Omnitrophota bacterium]MDD5546594.1 M48 family metallopeptidase [Candidatus Omnitrophota bacterium]
MKLPVLLALFPALLALTPVYAEYNTVTHRDESINMSTEQEVTIGDSVSKQVEKAYKLVDDKHMEERVELIGNNLAKVCDRKELIYHFKVLDINDINAVSLPGGWVYVFKGLVEKCKNDDELAGVIAHEIGHICARHSAKQQQTSSIMTAIMIAVTATGGGSASQATNLALSSLLAAYSREDEFEADRRAVIYTKKAGYDPYALITFMETMHEVGKDKIRSYTYFRSHPYEGERIGNINRQINGVLDFNGWINKPIDKDRW